VTSSHGAATPLRYGVTGHLAGNQPVRSRQAIVSLMNRPTASAARFAISHSTMETILVGIATPQQFEDALVAVQKGRLPSAALDRLLWVRTSTVFLLAGLSVIASRAAATEI
jgi:hypothetical protein